MKIKLAILDLSGEGPINGYIGVPQEHPWFNKEWDELGEIDIHGGVSWAKNTLPQADKPDTTTWWIGFDTAHYQDTRQEWTTMRVALETERLRILAAYAITSSTSPR